MCHIVKFSVVTVKTIAFELRYVFTIIAVKTHLKFSTVNFLESCYEIRHFNEQLHSKDVREDCRERFFVNEPSGSFTIVKMHAGDVVCVPELASIGHELLISL